MSKISVTYKGKEYESYQAMGRELGIDGRKVRTLVREYV